MAQIALVAKAGMELWKGREEKKLANEEAKELSKAGRREMAATTHDVAAAEKTKELMESRAMAVGAAQGAGLSDPTMVKLIGDLNAEGEYRMLQALYTGSDRAMGLYDASGKARRSGNSAMRRAQVNDAQGANAKLLGAGKEKQGAG
jgi:hypothetical protein